MQAGDAELDAEEGTERPEDEAVEEVDGEDVGKYEDDEFEGEEFLDYRAELDDDLEADGEGEAVEPGEEVLWVGCVAGLGDGEAAVDVRVDGVFVGSVVDLGPLGEEVHEETGDAHQTHDGEEGVVDYGPGVKPGAPFVVQVEIGEHDGDVEVGSE